MFAHVQRHQDKRWQWEEQVSEEVEKQQQIVQDLKFDLQKVAILALTHRDAEMKSCATEMWSKWSLQGPMPRRPTKESTRVKDISRLRAKRRWNYLSRFVSYAFAKTRRRSSEQHTALHFLAFRVKELCDLFQSSFDEKFGVYEALLTCIRRSEIEQSVKEKLNRPKNKVLEKSCTGTFEELELEMKSTYTDAFEEAGGTEEVSSQIPEVAELVRSYRHGRVRQDLGFEILGLKSLYRVNHRWLLKFEDEVQRLANSTRGVATIAPMKSYDRARAKVLTRYGSDVSCITDVMRASLIYPTIAEVYYALGCILKEDQEQPRHDFRVMEVNDRFQFCHDGYRDITLLFDMSGVICEVQMQIKGIQDVKKSGGHKAYRMQREINELIFEAAVQNSEEDVAELIKIYKVSGQGTKDKNGRSALHYTCQHGALKATRVLLAAGSNPWLEDDHGVLPFELALKQKLFDTMKLTLSAMMQKAPRYGKGFHRIAEQILPWWCANIARLPPADVDFLHWREAGKLMIDVLTCYQALPLVEPFLTSTAKLGTAFASMSIRALLTAGADQVLKTGSESLLDYAMKSGHAEMVKMLVCMQRGDGTPYAAHCFKETIHGHLKIASKLADSGYARAALLANADPRAQQAFGVGKRTALMSFAAAGDLELCQELVAARSEVQWIDGSCCSAVHYALSLKRTPVVEFLRSQRAITEVPLKHSSLQDVAQYLLKATQEGCCGAVHRGADSLRNMQFLKKQNEAIPFKDVLRERFGPSRWTLLHYAVKVLRSADPAGQVCRALLLAKADPRLLCADGETALHWAASLGHQQVLDALAQGAHRAEADDQTLQSIGRGDEVDWDLPDAEVLVSDTQKALKRQLLRIEAEKGMVAKPKRDDDGMMWLQAGLLAFKHALLCKRLTCVEPQESSPSPRRLNRAKTKVDGFRGLKPQTSLKASASGRRLSTRPEGQKLTHAPSSASNSPRPSRANIGKSKDEGQGIARAARKTMTAVKAFNRKALDVPETMPRSGASPTSGSSSNPGSRPNSARSSASNAPAGPKPESRPGSAAMSRQVSGSSRASSVSPSGPNVAPQISGGSNERSSMSRQVSGDGQVPGSMIRQISGSQPAQGCMSRQVSSSSDEGRKIRHATFKDEVEER